MLSSETKIFPLRVFNRVQCGAVSTNEGNPPTYDRYMSFSSQLASRSADNLLYLSPRTVLVFALLLANRVTRKIVSFSTCTLPFFLLRRQRPLTGPYPDPLTSDLLKTTKANLPPAKRRRLALTTIPDDIHQLIFNELSNQDLLTLTTVSRDMAVASYARFFKNEGISIGRDLSFVPVSGDERYFLTVSGKTESLFCKWCSTPELLKPRTLDYASPSPTRLI